MHKQNRRTSVKQAKLIVNTRSCSIPIHVVSLGEVGEDFVLSFLFTCLILRFLAIRKSDVGLYVSFDLSEPFWLTGC